MNQSPVLSPRPNPPGPGAKSLHPKAKALAILHSSNAPATTTTASDSGDFGQDLAARMNDEVRDSYVIGKHVGHGTYADVFVAHRRHDPKSLFAIKKMKINPDFKDGMSIDAIREIKHLAELDHPHILKLFEVFTTKEQNISLVLEFVPNGDLQKMWQDRVVAYSAADIKSWIHMLCSAVWYCHEHRVLHRDIKGNNLLLAANGSLKLADFGLARSFADPGRPMTYNVITQYYRPPELLYGARHYGAKVDIWSIGIVMGELCIKDFVFRGETEIQMLGLIFDLLGTPTEETWPGVSSLAYYMPPASQQNGLLNGVAPRKAKPLSAWRERFALLGDDGIDLLRQMWQLDPKKRYSAKQVLEHRYWTSAPRPTRQEDLPKNGGGEKQMGEALKRGPGNMESGRADKVARKLDFASMR